jgi:ankyrin repeat protein
MTELKRDIFDAVAEGNETAVKALASEDPSQLLRLNAEHLTALHRATVLGDVKMAELLLSLGADVNAPDGIKATPLHRAVISGNSELAGILLKRGADLKATDSLGLTALCIAVRDGHYELAKFLISRGADLKGGANDLGLTPLHRAVLIGSRDMVKLLIAKGAGVNARDASGITPYRLARRLGVKEIAELLKKYGGKR